MNGVVSDSSAVSTPQTNNVGNKAAKKPLPTIPQYRKGNISVTGHGLPKWRKQPRNHYPQSHNTEKATFQSQDMVYLNEQSIFSPSDVALRSLEYRARSRLVHVLTVQFASKSGHGALSLDCLGSMGREACAAFVDGEQEHGWHAWRNHQACEEGMLTRRVPVYSPCCSVCIH